METDGVDAVQPTIRLCGHCGTEVKEGFSVCTGCGARLELVPNVLGALLGVVFAPWTFCTMVFTVVTFVVNFRALWMYCVVNLVLYLAFATVITKYGQKRAWVRRD